MVLVFHLNFHLHPSFSFFKSAYWTITSSHIALTYYIVLPRNDRKVLGKSRDDPVSIESIDKAVARVAKATQKKKKTDRPPVLRDIPKLTKDLLMQSSKAKTLKEAQDNAISAAKKLYELCDVGHKSNREVMVASGQYDLSI